jgi:acyl-coenzyme A thioesterase PaaI-like protein
MRVWAFASIVGLNLSYKASTVGIHVNYHAAAIGEDVVAQARTLRRNNEIFLNSVTVSGRSSGMVVATGSVTYRIVVSE